MRDAGNGVNRALESRSLGRATSKKKEKERRSSDKMLSNSVGSGRTGNIWLYVLMNGHERAKHFLIRRFPLSQYARIIT